MHFWLSFFKQPGAKFLKDGLSEFSDRQNLYYHPKVECTDVYKQILPPEEPRVEEQFFQKGTEAEAKFRFFSNRNVITIAPLVVQFSISQQESNIFEKKGVKGSFANIESNSTYESPDGTPHGNNTFAPVLTP